MKRLYCSPGPLWSYLFYLLLTYLLLWCWPPLCAQDLYTLRGTVLAADPPPDGGAREPEPLPGASLRLRGTDQGTTTDALGTFTLTVRSNRAALTVSYIGYRTLDTLLSLPLRQPLRLVLTPDASQLREVTVSTGYWQTSQRLNTGNISQVTAETLEKQPVTNVLQALTGRMAGVVVTQSTGLPGASVQLQIRGLNSIAQGNQPFFVIDGVPFAPGNDNLQQLSSALTYRTNGLSPFSSLNPADIERIEVLKDADATAIYGSRGANGVVLITTKSGQTGKTRLELSGATGLSRITRQVDWLDTPRYLQMRREAFANDGVALTDANAYDLLRWDTTRYTNWQQELIGGTARFSRLQATLSGGTAGTQFRLGGGYQRETSVFPGKLANQRGSLQGQLQHQDRRQRLTLTASGTYAVQDNHLPVTDLTTLTNLPPNLPPLYDAAGKLNWSEGGYAFDNPLAYLERTYAVRVDHWLLSGLLRYRLAPGLTARSPGVITSC